ncbi:hypothetical protein INR49_003915, partial [Caranx melampygus]
MVKLKAKSALYAPVSVLWLRPLHGVWVGLCCGEEEQEEDRTCCGDGLEVLDEDGGGVGGREEWPRLPPQLGHFLRLEQLELTIVGRPADQMFVALVEQKLQQELPQSDGALHDRMTPETQAICQALTWKEGRRTRGGGWRAGGGLLPSSLMQNPLKPTITALLTVHNTTLTQTGNFLSRAVNPQTNNNNQLHCVLLLQD